MFRNTTLGSRVGKYMHNHYNGLKTTLLFSGIFALLLALGSLFRGGSTSGSLPCSGSP